MQWSACNRCTEDETIFLDEESTAEEFEIKKKKKTDQKVQHMESNGSGKRNWDCANAKPHVKYQCYTERLRTDRTGGMLRRFYRARSADELYTSAG